MEPAESSAGSVETKKRKEFRRRIRLMYREVFLLAYAYIIPQVFDNSRFALVTRLRTGIQTRVRS